MQDTQTQPRQIDEPAAHEIVPNRIETVVAVVVTWNRMELVSNVLSALVAQTRACQSLHVVVVDNASTDGTSEYLTKKFAPERVIKNQTSQALSPKFSGVDSEQDSTNTLGFASMTVVCNTENLGGCGGFNTGFQYVEHQFGESGKPGSPDFVWLLDDDIDLPAEALARLLLAARLDHDISLVGSRTVDIKDRRTTIESTIYFDPATGLMGPEPAANHPLLRDHTEWASSAKDEVGNRVYSGVRDVDIVSACSMLARWSDVCDVGLWDERFFIYCDDADWCLRFKTHGKRVVCALDAIVFHTPWTHKLTPERGYYFNRNHAWMIRKNVGRDQLRMALLKWAARLMSQAKSAILNRRLRDAQLLMDAVSDSLNNVGGKHSSQLPKSEEVLDSLTQAGALGADKRIVLCCPGPEQYLMAERFRSDVQNQLIDSGRAEQQPEWIILAHDGAVDPVHGGEAPTKGEFRSRVREYRSLRLSKIRTQIDWLRDPPDAFVVFGNACNYPLIRGRTTVHVANDYTSQVVNEQDGIFVKLKFATRWVILGFRVVIHVARARPIKPNDHT